MEIIRGLSPCSPTPSQRRKRHLTAKSEPSRLSTTCSSNVPEIHVSGRIQRAGKSLVILIPAETVRIAKLAVGDPFDAILRTPGLDPLGLLNDLVKGEFDRRREGLWRERI
jgi:hypothetical protein